MERRHAEHSNASAQFETVPSPCTAKPGANADAAESKNTVGSTRAERTVLGVETGGPVNKLP
jgi:hypothetical protein